MPQPNVEIICRLYDDWVAGDYDAVVSTYAADIRLNPDPEAWWVGMDEEYLGPDGVARYMEAVYEAFEDYRPEIEQMIDVGEDECSRSLSSMAAGVGAVRRCRRAASRHVLRARRNIDHAPR